MKTPAMTPEENQIFFNKSPKKRQKLLYDTDRDEAWVLNRQLDGEIDKLKVAGKLIEEQEKVKKQAESIIADITGKPASEQKESVNTILELETENFRVDSSGWKTKVKNWFSILVNKERDITEFLDGKFKWEQLFSFDAMMRETGKAWKSVPSKEQWEKICKPYKNDGERMSKELNLPMVGYRGFSDGSLNFQGSFGIYWSSSPNSTDGYNLDFDSTAINPARYDNRADGFSVRCLKN